MRSTRTALPAVALVRAAVAEALDLPTGQIYRIVETEIAFPGDFAVIAHGIDTRFALITETGARIETGHLRPAEYQILGCAVPFEAYGEKT
jgi:hypothetical protein